MADPFDGLRLPNDPIEPDAAFATALRERLERALVLPKGVTVSELTVDRPGLTPSGDEAPSAVHGRAAITVYLAVSGAHDAIAWYGGALGARLTGDPIVMPDGRIGHAELDIAGARLMLSEENPEIGIVAPTPGAGATFTVHLAVADVDAVVERCVAAGAVLEREPADYDYGRNGVIRDPFGHRWLIASEAEAETAPDGLRHGDIGYVSLWVPDVGRAASFFGHVLGWDYEPVDGDRPQGRRVADRRLHHGLWGGVAEPTLFCCYAVDDADRTAQQIREAGGEASEPHEEPYGRLVEAPIRWEPASPSSRLPAALSPAAPAPAANRTPVPARATSST
ncbi:MAG TPA: VOC family protein [Acidimicrobiales bacterium]|nr:VOC family protein [Acidimicrobiales bacterium]